jgi:hypothetical protein
MRNFLPQGHNSACDTLHYQLLTLHYQVGDLSPKGRVGVSRLALVLSRQSVLPSGLEFDFLPKTGANRLSPT